MTTVGLIGSGNIGITVAQLAIEVGHQVVLSNSRGPKGGKPWPGNGDRAIAVVDARKRSSRRRR